MKFIADVMLGKLAKYMRMCGYDVQYYNDIDDTSLIEKALSEDRILLTRDRLMLKRKEIRDDIIGYCYIRNKTIRLQLNQLKGDMDVRLKLKFKRCVKCNSLLVKTEKERAKGIVPEYVFKMQEKFYYCSGCGKFYWNGTHKKNMEIFFKENF